MSFRMRLYGFLVNRVPGITYKYHKVHDGSFGFSKFLSYVYLIWLNFAYYILFCRFIGKLPKQIMFEDKKIPCKTSESEANLKANPKLKVSEYVEKAKSYDYVSFDVFDTLIFRPLSQPTDLFYFIGKELGIMDFKNIRTWAEADARFKCYLLNKHYEIGLPEIWENLSEDQGTDAKNGMLVEETVEKNLCYANPFMLKVWNELKKQGTKIVVVSDMYLPERIVREILEKNGFTGAEKIYVSNEYSKNKYEGKLFKYVANDLYGNSSKNKDNNSNNIKILHIGDNPKSDNESAKKAGWDAMPYIQTNKYMILYRAFDMSYMVGSAYRAVVNNFLYNGLESHSMEYEYGFVYGGIFVLGYCNFIHDYCHKNNIDKLLFLSRDGDILIKAYDYMFPGENTEYVYWSRKAATKLMADYDRHDYFRRFIYHKINQDYTIKDILKSMEIEFLVDELSDWKGIWEKWNKEHYKGKDYEAVEKKYIDLKPDDELTEKNGYLLRRFIDAKWDKVLKYYSEQEKAAKEYWTKHTENASKVVAIDIGWAGSGALALSFLIEKAWDLPCEIIGIIAGTNTLYNSEPDASEPFLQSGKLVAYLYSQSHNRDLLKKHDPNKDYNVFWELLLSSPNPRFEGFYADGPRFGKTDANPKGIREVQLGIMDFVREYTEHFKEYPYMFNISGRDAYAPLLAASGNKEKYLKTIEKKFDLNINVE
ncbi:MAG: HAD hydrolase-like protein [Lachnospiraceae bacterium]|nr:HAD hydrolase-like protein [Lachnospiraceae bacterium]